MYIKKIEISNFRNFQEASVPFHEGVNVILGHNNTGKSNLLRAIGLVLGFSDGHRLGTSDIFYDTNVATLKLQSPRIQITLVLHRSEGEDLDSAEMGLFSSMMTDPTLSEEAELRYEFKLADTQEDNYKADVAEATTAKEIWKIIDHDYIRFYRSSRSGGNQAAGISVNDALGQIDFQFLDAIRDVSHDLYAGYNPLLRDVLNFFIDYSVKNDAEKTEDEIKEQLKTLRDNFVLQSAPLMHTLQSRLQNGKNVFLKYAVDTGATFNGAVPDFDGEVTENEMFAVGQINVGYPRVIYKKDIADDMNSKQYVQRFLDATKADMFFANKLIFVEGVAEELLLPVFARYMNKNLTDEHVLVVNMGGRYFNHFLKLFDTNNAYAINKKIVCLTDIDPCRKKNVPNAEYEACYPYEYNIDTANYNYMHHADTEVAQYASHPNIRFYRQDVMYGKTLEYDIMRENPNCELLLTDSVSNISEIKAMMAERNLNDMIGKLRKSDANTRIKTSIEASGWTDEEKRKAVLASRYLNSVSKGSNALELNVALMINLEKPEADRIEFHVPQYIVDALTWLLS